MVNGCTSIKKEIVWKVASKYGLHLFFVLFILGQLFFTYKEVETLPFYNYGMYSAPLSATDTFEQLEIFIEGQAWNYHAVSAFPADFIEAHLAFYNKLHHSDFKDPVSWTVRSRFGPNSVWENRLTNKIEVRERFPHWLGRYLKGHDVLEAGEQLTLMRRRYVYNQAGWPQPVDSVQLMSYAVE